MIKKSIFEDDLINGMQKELHKEASDNLDKAVDYLHSVIDIFEDAGMTEKADQVFNIIKKIASTYKESNVKVPSLKEIMEQGVTQKDIKNSIAGDYRAIAKITNALKNLNYNDKNISLFLGQKRAMTNEEITDFSNPNRALSRFWKLINASDEQLVDENDARKKPKNPLKINDPHIKGLTSEKMIKNLKHHGTVFNMPADDQLLDVEFANDLEVSDEELEDFEDES